VPEKVGPIKQIWNVSTEFHKIAPTPNSTLIGPVETTLIHMDRQNRLKFWHNHSRRHRLYGDSLLPSPIKRTWSSCKVPDIYARL